MNATKEQGRQAPASLQRAFGSIYTHIVGGGQPAVEYIQKAFPIGNQWEARDQTGTPGGGNIPFTKTRLSYTDFQPNAGSSGSISSGDSIPVGDHILEYFAIEIVEPVGVSSATIFLASASEPSGYTNTQQSYLIGNPGEQLDFRLITVQFPGVPSIDNLTAGEWDVYYRFTPIVTA